MMPTHQILVDPNDPDITWLIPRTARPAGGRHRSVAERAARLDILVYTDQDAGIIIILPKGRTHMVDTIPKAEEYLDGLIEGAGWHKPAAPSRE